MNERSLESAYLVAMHVPTPITDSYSCEAEALRGAVNINRYVRLPLTSSALVLQEGLATRVAPQGVRHWLRQRASSKHDIPMHRRVIQVKERTPTRHP